MTPEQLLAKQIDEIDYVGIILGREEKDQVGCLIRLQGEVQRLDNIRNEQADLIMKSWKDAEQARHEAEQHRNWLCLSVLLAIAGWSMWFFNRG